MPASSTNHFTLQTTFPPPGFRHLTRITQFHDIFEIARGIDISQMGQGGINADPRPLTQPFADAAF